MLGMRMGHRQELTQSQRLELTQTHKLEQEITQTVITSHAVCPECNRRMDDDEIRTGWLSEPLDFTTQCPDCGHRFVAELDTYNKETEDRNSFRYLCRDQLFWAMRALMQRRKRSNIGQVFLEREAPELFWNMIRHFGRYDIGRTAFTKWSTGA